MIDNTSLFIDIIDIFQSGEGLSPVFFRYEIDFYTPNGVVPLLRVMKVSQLDDYVNKHSSEIMVEASIGLGDYILDIFPYRKSLTAEIKAIPVLSTGGDVPNGEIRHQKMHVVLADNEDISVNSGGAVGVDREEMNRTNQYLFNFQLIDDIAYISRMYTVENIIKNTKIEDLLRSVLLTPPGVKGVSVVPPTNTELINQLIVDVGMKVVDFPGWLQNESGIGVYNAGLNWYLQSGYWYVFPVYDCTRYDSESEVLTICNVPKARMPNPEKTYFYRDGQLYILATGNVEYKDLTDVYQLNYGNMNRFSYANMLENEAYITESSGEVYFNKETSKKDVLSEVRSDGKNVGYYNGVTPTNNISRELSRIASHRGVIVTFEWINSEPGLLVPAMPCRFLYEDSGVVKSLYGVVLNKYKESRQVNPGMLNPEHQVVTKVQVFLERESNI